MYDNELYHHGIKGMRWGVRRYQNPDGSLTNAGRKRRKQNAHEDYIRAHSKKSIREMSDAELRSRNNRLQMEQQYKSLTKTTFSGKKILSTLIATAGTITAAEAAYKTYKRIGGQAVNGIIDKAGDLLIRDLNKGLARGL